MSSVIQLTTSINAPSETCFLLSLSVDVHQHSAGQSGEKAIAGVTQGIMQLNDTVTWEARHFGIKFHMTTKIPVYRKPDYFVSEMLKGPFKRVYHRHIFKEQNGHTEMTDVFEFEAPCSWLGKLAEKLFLHRHLRHFLEQRNQCIKAIAESGEHKRYLEAKQPQV